MVGKSGYDVVFPSASPFFARQVKAGLYRNLDLTKIPNAKGVDPKVLERLRMVDPGNAFGLPYMMAGTGIGYVKSKITPLLANPPIGSLAMLLDPKTVGAFEILRRHSARCPGGSAACGARLHQQEPDELVG